MRLLYVCENYWPMTGGAELANQSICEGMAARGHEVTAVTHRPRGAPLREQLNGVNVIRVPCMANRYLFTAAALPTLVKYASRADLLHTVTFNAAPPGWLAARLTRRRVLVTVWETWIGRWATHTTFSPIEAFMHEFMERAIFAFPYDRYVAISRATQASLRSALPGRANSIDCIYLGFDPAPWAVPCDRASIRADLNVDEAFLIVGYGRPGVSKGFRYVVEAAPLIAEVLPKAVILLILSDAAQYRAELGRLKSRAPSNVRFLPPQPVDRLVQIVRSSDCVVVPSISEGFGYTTLEAAAAGVPVVASRTTSIPEVIGGSFVFSEARNPRSIADGVAAVARGEAQRKPLRSFPWSKTIDEYEALYEHLSSSPLPRTACQP